MSDNSNKENTSKKLLEKEKNDSSSNTEKPTEEEEKKTPAWKYALIALVVAVVLYGAYYYYTNVMSSSDKPAKEAPPQQQQQNNNNTPNQDCVMSETVWGPCKNGVQTGTRTVLTPAQGSGKSCGALEETRSCISNTIASDSAYQMGLKFYGNADRSAIPDGPFKAQVQSTTLKCAEACLNDPFCLYYNFNAPDKCRLYQWNQDLTNPDVDPQITFLASGQERLRGGFKRLLSDKITNAIDINSYFQAPEFYQSTEEKFTIPGDTATYYYIDNKGKAIKWTGKQPKYNFFSASDIEKYGRKLYGYDLAACAEITRRTANANGFIYDEKGASETISTKADESPSCILMEDPARVHDPTDRTITDPSIYMTKSICVTGTFTPGTGYTAEATEVLPDGSCGNEGTKVLSHGDVFSNSKVHYARLNR